MVIRYYIVLYRLYEQSPADTLELDGEQFPMVAQIRRVIDLAVAQTGIERAGLLWGRNQIIGHRGQRVGETAGKLFPLILFRFVVFWGARGPSENMGLCIAV